MLPLNDPLLLQKKALIGGLFCGNEDTPINDPASGARLARVPQFGAAEADRAVGAAAAAFGDWSRRGAKGRSAILRRRFDGIATNRSVKESGNSREGSRHGLQEFTELKYLCLGELHRRAREPGTTGLLRSA